MKYIGAIMAAILVMLPGMNALAAHPSAISASESSTASDLIVVKKPETNNSATTKTTYGVTGTGKNGVSVAYYKYDGSVYNAILNSEGQVSQTKIGAAGVFYKQMSLSEGHNKFAVRAEYKGLCQVIYLDINLLKREVLDNVNSFTYDVQSIFTGWI